MNELKSINKRYETIAWGLGLIWIGILGIIPGNQNGIGLLSIGLILLGLNLLRYLKKIPVNGFSSILGIICSAFGVIVLVRQILGYPGFELDLFAIMLIVIGLYILIPSPKPLKLA